MMCSAITTMRILVAFDTSEGHQRVDVTPMSAQFVITDITVISSRTLSHTPIPPLFSAIGRRLQSPSKREAHPSHKSAPPNSCAKKNGALFQLSGHCCCASTMYVTTQTGYTRLGETHIGTYYQIDPQKTGALLKLCPLRKRRSHSSCTSTGLKYSTRYVTTQTGYTRLGQHTHRYSLLIPNCPAKKLALCSNFALFPNFYLNVLLYVYRAIITYGTR